MPQPCTCACCARLGARCVPTLQLAAMSPSLCCQLHLPCLVQAQTGGLGAMKVVKSAAHYTEAARDEITLLSQIAERDPGKRSRKEWVGVGVRHAAERLGGTARCKAAKGHGLTTAAGWHGCPPHFVQGSACAALHPCAVVPVHVSVPDLHTSCCAAEDAHYCCRMVDWFEHAGPHGRHVCMVFEVLGDNLLTLIRCTLLLI